MWKIFLISSLIAAVAVFILLYSLPGYEEENPFRSFIQCSLLSPFTKRCEWIISSWIGRRVCICALDAGRACTFEKECRYGCVMPFAKEIEKIETKDGFIVGQCADFPYGCQICINNVRLDDVKNGLIQLSVECRG